MVKHQPPVTRDLIWHRVRTPVNHRLDETVRWDHAAWWAQLKTWTWDQYTAHAFDQFFKDLKW